MSDEARCPHCQTVLPEAATFCAACGNRMEGWSAVPVAEQPTRLPGGDEPTTNMQPTPSLLRAAALSVKKPVKKRPQANARRVPPGIYFVAGVAAAVGAYFVASRTPAPLPPVSHPLIVSPVPIAAAPWVASPAPVAKKPPRHHAPHLLEAMQVSSKKVSVSSGGLPHKSVKTDSKPLKIDPVATQSAVLQPAADAPVEAAPRTDNEMKKEAEASIDADGVRFVVKSHLAQVHACYERAFKETSPGGRVEIGFAITPDGGAARVRTESNSTGSESLASCLEGRVKSWQFPRPVGGDYELIYPFVFAAGS